MDVLIFLVLLVNTFIVAALAVVAALIFAELTAILVFMILDRVKPLIAKKKAKAAEEATEEVAQEATEMPAEEATEEAVVSEE